MSARTSALLRRMVPLLAVLLVIAALLPHPASADSLFNPADNVRDITQRFYPTAQAWAFKLYSLLIFFEIVALGVTAILFRDNIGELFSGMALKVFVGSVFLYFVANGQTFFQDVVNGFSAAGMRAGGSNSGTPLALTATGITSGSSFFYAADRLAAADKAKADLASPALDQCSLIYTQLICPFVQLMEVGKGSKDVQYILEGLGTTLIVTFCAIQLQLIVISIESYIVMFAGVFFIGFAGSRFTLPFAQGYFNYMISVGVKLFSTYLIAGIVSTLIVPILFAAVAEAWIASANPLGAGGITILVPAVVATFESAMAAVLIWSIPNYAAAFLSGQSSASASSLLNQVASSLGPVHNLARASLPKKGSDTGQGATVQPHGGNGYEVAQAAQNTAPAAANVKDLFATSGTRDAAGAAPNLAAANGTGGALGNIGLSTAPGAAAPRAAQFANAPSAEPKLRLSNPDRLT